MNKKRTPSAERLGPLKLVDVLRQLPEREIKSLIQRLGFRVDAAKRIDVPSQVARALLQLPEVRDPAQLPPPTRELLYRIAEAQGALEVEALPPAVEPLVARGIVYARSTASGIELLLPIAFLLQLRLWEGEDPRGVRALLCQVNPDVASSVASHYLGRTATPPLALSLESAWCVLSSASRLRAEFDELAPLERKLLRSVEEVGGEVDTEELLDLEREPMRLRGATGATPSRRGVGFALERRGFLVPVHPNRHVIPTEVAAVVGEQRRAEREAQRREIQSFVFAEDHAPRRARFAEDPVPLALAMALSVRDPSVDIRPGVGTPRSLVAKFASRFGRESEAVAFMAALSRAIGLWDATAVSAASPPGSHSVEEVHRALFETWRRGGAWDEARPDGEVLRATGEAREASVVGVVREMVLEALCVLGDGQWVPWEAVAAYVRLDGRTPGVARLIERWASRAAVEAIKPVDVAQRVALESLHFLGIVDLGDADENSVEGGPSLRVTPRGRAYLLGADHGKPPDASRFVDNQLLRIGSAARVGHVLGLAPFIEISAVSDGLDVTVTPQSMSLALSAGVEPDAIRARLEALAPLPDPISRQLIQASTVIGRAELVNTQGFLWVEDPEIRELLRTRRQSADLFVDPSPPAGLLVAPGVDLDRLARRCRSLGVELIVDGEVYRARSMAPSGRGSGAWRMDSSSSQSSAKSPGSVRRSRRSSASIPARRVD
ncbi:MAG TPA: hypothetical protein VF989_01190 [Polyangiaceae bacterium]|jgi:hypothetical protein